MVHFRERLNRFSDKNKSYSQKAETQLVAVWVPVHVRILPGESNYVKHNTESIHNGLFAVNYSQYTCAFPNFRFYRQMYYQMFLKYYYYSSFGPTQ